jgi:hypothetical protein
MGDTSRRNGGGRGKIHDDKVCLEVGRVVQNAIMKLFSLPFECEPALSELRERGPGSRAGQGRELGTERLIGGL